MTQLPISKNAAVTRAYGSTEVPVSAVGVLDRALVRYAAETDGLPGFAQLRLSASGEVCAKGPQMLAGYLRQSDEEGAFDRDGFYRTGDQGEWLDGEYLVITGRTKDIIIRNGENIAPKEIEDLLVQHDAIAEVAIVGLPDIRTGERACAFIVPAGETGPDRTMVCDYLDALGVARFKWPEQIEIRQTLPKNDAGKVLKHVLSESAGQI